MVVIYLLGFALGAAIGSFINMLSYRLHHKQSLAGRSFCDETGEDLKPIDLIPIVSYVIFKGKSRTSGMKLPIRYPIIEIISGIIFLLIFIDRFSLFIPYFQMFFELVIALLFGFFVLFFSVYDQQYWQLHRKMLLISILLGVVLNSLVYFTIELLEFSPTSNFLAAILTMVVSSIIVTIAKRIKGRLEYNDVLFLTFLALFLGLESMFYASLFSVFIGLIIGLISMFITKAGIKTAIPFAPLFLIPGIVFFLYETEVLGFLSGILGV